MVAEERAKLRVEVDDLAEQPVVNGVIPETYVVCNIRNFGGSKASIISANFGATFDSSAKRNKKIDTAIPMTHKLPNEIESGVLKNLRVMVLPRQLNSDDFKAVANGTAFVRFFGSIRYADVFDVERETRSYLRWHPIVKLMNYGVWEKIGRKKDNKAT